MEKQVARISDRWQGICICHKKSISVGGTIITGSPDTYANNLNIARLGDIVLGDCGHTGSICTCSATVKANGLGIARIGDQVTGCLIDGAIITGSPDTFTE